MVYPKHFCDCNVEYSTQNDLFTISKEGINRTSKRGDITTICVSKTNAMKLASGAGGAIGAVLGSLGGGASVALLAYLTGMAVSEFGAAHIPAFCAEVKITIPQVPWWLAGFAPPPTMELIRIWRQ